LKFNLESIKISKYFAVSSVSITGTESSSVTGNSVIDLLI